MIVAKSPKTKEQEKMEQFAYSVYLLKLYDELMSKMRYIGSNNCKSIPEEEVKFIFRQLGIYEQ